MRNLILYKTKNQFAIKLYHPVETTRNGKETAARTHAGPKRRRALGTSCGVLLPGGRFNALLFCAARTSHDEH